MSVNQEKLGLYKRLKLEKIKKELEEIQGNGKESILLIAEKLEKELIDQGYKVGINIEIWHHEDSKIEVCVESGSVRIGGRFYDRY